MDYLQLSAQNQAKAYAVIEDLKLVERWQAIGARINLVGSLKLGLLMKHLDIDFHIYSSQSMVVSGFSVISQLVENPRIKRMSYINSLDTDENCLEWHLVYEESDGNEWQIDLIYMPDGSPYDGYFERVAERISVVLDDEMRNAILRLKYETPDSVKIMGIEYYRAVIEGGVRTWPELLAWRDTHPVQGVLAWMP